MRTVLWVGFLCASLLPFESWAAPLDRSIPRGDAIVKHPGETPDSPAEICVVPRHLAIGKYSDKDRKAEQLLCKIDFYVDGDTEKAGGAALCPKHSSTSAAVLLNEIPAAKPKAYLQNLSVCSQEEQPTGKIGKFKQTDNDATCTSTASLLGYYHLSRALGGIAEVSPAVIRTMDIEGHKPMVKMADEMKLKGLIAKSWKNFHTYYANPKGSEVASTLFTSDFKQIYGAIVRHRGGSEEHLEWEKVGSKVQLTQAYKDMANGERAGGFLDREFKPQTIQRLVGMRDMSEMLLLDYLMSQSDRFSGGNISMIPTHYYEVGNEIRTEPFSKSVEGKSEIPPGAPKIKVNKLFLKDNDCGLLNGNTVADHGHLYWIFHLHPETYTRLLKLAWAWELDGNPLKNFLRKEALFTSSELSAFGTRLKAARDQLKKRCLVGKLHLDLDLVDHLSKGNLPEVMKTWCEKGKPDPAAPAGN